MGSIRLSSGQGVIVDGDDFEWAARQRWSHSGRTATKPGYAAHGGKTNGKRWVRYMHREIAERAGIIEAGSRLQVDHVDGDTFNNRRSNLRAATLSLNASNVHVVRTSSGFTGVYRLRATGWGFEITRNGHRNRKYGFATAEAAAEARAAIVARVGY